MITKDWCVQKYQGFKADFKRVPKYREFLKYAECPKMALIKIFGDDAFTKLQIECGDDANKLIFEKTPLDQIMRQYGDLVKDCGKAPSSSTWIQKGYRPGPSGLEKAPHHIKWGEFPNKFIDWAQTKTENDYAKAVEILVAASKPAKVDAKRDPEFEKIIEAVRLWSPARRRNSEGEYKIELRKHLESLGFNLNEEFGESNFDLLINKRYAIEIKKDPNLSEYDRLFGQLARHLQHQLNIIALIMDAPSEDKFQNFAALVDTYLNKDDKVIEVIKR